MDGWVKLEQSYPAAFPPWLCAVLLADIGPGEPGTCVHLTGKEWRAQASLGVSSAVGSAGVPARWGTVGVPQDGTLVLL